MDGRAELGVGGVESGGGVTVTVATETGVGKEPDPVKLIDTSTSP